MVHGLIPWPCEKLLAWIPRPLGHGFGGNGSLDRTTLWVKQVGFPFNPATVIHFLQRGQQQPRFHVPLSEYCLLTQVDPRELWANCKLTDSRGTPSNSMMKILLPVGGKYILCLSEIPCELMLKETLRATLTVGWAGLSRQEWEEKLDRKMAEGGCLAGEKGGISGREAMNLGGWSVKGAK